MHKQEPLQMRNLSGKHVLLASDHAGLGGTRTYAEQLTRLFCDSGARVTLVLNDEACSAALEIPSAAGQYTVISYREIVGHPDQTAGQNGFRKKLTGLFAPRYEKQAFSDYVRNQAVDHVVVSVGRPGSLLGAVRSQAESTYILHTYPHGWKNILIGRLFYGRQIRRGTTIVTVSDYAKRSIEKSWGLTRSADRVRRIYSTAGPLVTLPPRAPGPISVLTVGGVEDFKDPLAWIDLALAVSRNLGRENVVFTWLGSGRLLEECRRRSQAVADQATIRFLGATSDVAIHYDSADVYIQSSRVESLGLAVLDATRRGLPCLVTNAGGLPEIIKDGVNGYVVESLRLPETARLLISLALDGQVTADMAVEAIRGYEEKFAPRLWTEQVLNLVPEVR